MGEHLQKGEEKIEEQMVDSAKPVEGSCSLRINTGSWFPTAVEEVSTGQADEHLDAGKQNADAEITEKLDDASDLDGKKLSFESSILEILTSRPPPSAGSVHSSRANRPAATMSHPARRARPSACWLCTWGLPCSRG